MEQKTKQTLTKPLGLVRKELQENIIDAINESGLPLSMTAYIVRDILENINLAVTQQEKAEIDEYEAKLAKFKDSE